MDSVHASTIREILKVTEQPEIISFAGGLPAPELFPVDDLLSAAERVLHETGASALQYSPSEGYAPLRESLAAESRRRGIDCSAEDILITTGSQQPLDLAGKIFLDAGDCVLTESPTYMAAIQAFQTFEVRFATVPTDDHGLISEELPALIERERPKFLYTIPNFQNPTGRTLAAQRRKTLYSIAARYGLIVIEDDPYGCLRYAGKTIPPLKSLDTEGIVIYLSTVSKTIAPGLRIGWVVAREEIRRKLTIVKQAADLHTSSLDQRIVHRYLTDFDSSAHIERIRQASGIPVDTSRGRNVPLGNLSRGRGHQRAAARSAFAQSHLCAGAGFFPRFERPAIHAPELLQRFAGLDSRRHRPAGGGLQGCGSRARIAPCQ
jgi:2-aminoadipate transaminase